MRSTSDGGVLVLVLALALACGRDPLGAGTAAPPVAPPEPRSEAGVAPPPAPPGPDAGPAPADAAPARADAGPGTAGSDAGAGEGPVARPDLVARPPADAPPADGPRLDGAADVARAEAADAVARDVRIDAPAARPIDGAALEAVTRMARLLWRAEPDAGLRARAESGAFRTVEDLRVLAREMLRDPRARAGVGAFYRWWLDLERLPAVTKSAAVFPTFDAEVAAAMAADAERFGVVMTLDRESSWNDLLTHHLAFGGRVAAALGEDGVQGRYGIFTQPAFLALQAQPTHGSPTRRGAFLRRRLLCQEIPPHPPGVSSDVSPVPPGKTTREHYQGLLSDPVCHACHQLMDWIGYAYENYDGIGRLRLYEAGKPIDQSGAINALPTSGRVLLDVPPETAQTLRDLPEARACFVRQWFRHALGRPPAPEDEDAIEEAYQAFVASSRDIRELIVRVSTSTPFLR